jgi:hypothetical protein
MVTSHGTYEPLANLLPCGNLSNLTIGHPAQSHQVLEEAPRGQLSFWWRDSPDRLRSSPLLVSQLGLRTEALDDLGEAKGSRVCSRLHSEGWKQSSGMIVSC